MKRGLGEKVSQFSHSKSVASACPFSHRRTGKTQFLCGNGVKISPTHRKSPNNQQTVQTAMAPTATQEGSMEIEAVNEVKYH